MLSKLSQHFFHFSQLQIVSTLRRAASILHFSPAQHKCFPQLPRASKLETANISSRKARVRKILPASATRLSLPTFTHRYLLKLSWHILQNEDTIGHQCIAMGELILLKNDFLLFLIDNGYPIIEPILSKSKKTVFILYCSTSAIYCK